MSWISSVKLRDLSSSVLKKNKLVVEILFFSTQRHRIHRVAQRERFLPYEPD